MNCVDACHLPKLKRLAASITRGLGVGLCIVIIACSPAPTPTPTPLNLIFMPYYGQQALPCDLSFIHNGEKWQVDTLGFYLFGLTQTIPSQLSIHLPTNNWQSENIALVWFTQTCEADQPASKINQTVRTIITGDINTTIAEPLSIGELQQLSFTLGIPFASNHQNPLTQASPLNIPEMFWSWQAGHKFMRLDASQIDGHANWAFHLGSLGCRSASALRAPEAACSQANRFDFSLDLSRWPHEQQLSTPHAPASLIIKFDIGALLHNVDIASSTACMFELEHSETCSQLMQNLTNNPIFSVIFSVIDEDPAP